MENQTFIYNAKGDVNLVSVSGTIQSEYSGNTVYESSLTFYATGTWIANAEGPFAVGDGTGNYISGGTLGSAFRIKYSAYMGGDISTLHTLPVLSENVWHTLSTNIKFYATGNNGPGVTEGGTIDIRIEKISNPSNFGTHLVTILAEGGCVASDTMILLSDGTYKSAGTLTLTDTLISFTVTGMIDTDQPNWNTWTTTDISTRAEVTSGIVALNTFTKPSYVLINNNFKTTLSHTNFICRSGTYQWCASNQIVVGDSFVLRDGALLPITDVQTINIPQEFTYINVEAVDTFFVSAGGNTFVTHNLS